MSVAPKHETRGGARAPISETTVRRDASLKPEELLALYRFMSQMREFEDAVLRLYRQGKIVGGAYSGNGNEATAVGSAYALSGTDYLFPMHRDLGAHLVKGQNILNLMRQHLGRAGGKTRGRDGTGHYSDPALKIYGNISHLGSMVPVACGVALASKLRREGAVVMTYIGDGGASVGEVHEGLAMASAMSLPLILVIENNQYAYSTPVARQSRVDKLSKRAAGYGIPGSTIDGTNVLEVYHACAAAIERARNGGGPSVVESLTMRMHGHAAHDTAWYVPKHLLDEWKKKDPVEQFEKFLITEGVLDETKVKDIAHSIRVDIEKAVETVLNEPYPPADEAVRGVYAV